MKQGEFLCKDALFVKRKYVMLGQNFETGSATPSKVNPKTVRSGHHALIRFLQMTVSYRLGKGSPEV